MTDLNEKALEAAARALWPTTNISDFMMHALKDGITAYLSALVQDEATVERVAEAICDAMNMNRVGRLELDAARAALSALGKDTQT